MDQTPYFKIRVGSLLPNSPIPFDVHILLNGKYITYVRAGDSITQEKLNKLNQADVFYIAHEMRQKYKDFIHGRLNEESLTVEKKALILRESSMGLVEELYESPNIGAALSESKEIINQFVKFIDESPTGLSHLLSLSTHDFYTYNHSLDVSVYALGLGRAAGYSGEDLTELGRGAIFHDVGKREVDVNIICKQGPLDDSEWAQMQQHPTFGLQILSEHDASAAVIACCFEHHENFLGNGYPQQLKGEDIHPMARIVALCDTYDALTTKRSYNVPMLAVDALTFIKDKLGKRYDPELMIIMNELLLRMEKEISKSA